MKISFVIPAYNEEATIAHCLEAIQKELRNLPALAGGAWEAEVVVVNNASSDGTRKVALAFAGVRVVDEPHKGLVYARRAGHQATSGELVAHIDADTRMPRGWLARVIKNFETRPNLVALSGPYIYHDLTPVERAMVKIFYFPGWLFDTLMQPVLGHATMLQGGNFVLKRDAWDKAGGFDTSLIFYGEDADVARRISKHGRVLWTWSLPMYASGRRLRKEGVLKTGFTYLINLFWTHSAGRPITKEYTDVRAE